MHNAHTPHPAPKPLIGITGRQSRGSLIGSPSGFVDAPLDIYLREYAQCVLAAGGIPVHIPLETDATALIGRIDGLIIAGGEDVDPRRFGLVPGPHTQHIDPQRDEIELALLAAATERGLPVLGVCRGHQLINVAYGGTLIQHLEPNTESSHMATEYPRAHRVHEVTLTPGTVAHTLYGERTVTNSFHHQAVNALGTGITVAGVAHDGVVEAIEVTGRPIIGVQWHPECFTADPIFDWLLEQARQLSPHLSAPTHTPPPNTLNAAGAAKENQS